MDKINPLQIIKDHWSTFYDARINARNRRPTNLEAFLYVIFGPAIISIILVRTGSRLDANDISLVMTAASIFAGLFLNLLMLVFGLATRQTPKETPNADQNRFALRSRLLIELSANISFAVLVSISIALTCLVYVAYSAAGDYMAFKGILYYLVVLLIITVLMVLKRTHAAYKGELTN